MSGTLVIQSHRQPLPFKWLDNCLESVRSWSQSNGFDYRFYNDDLFQIVDDDIRTKLAERPVILSDIARLRALQQGLKEGYQRVVWCDADFLIFAPQNFILPQVDYALGREHWIQATETGRLRCYSKVHNAFMLFRQGNSFLNFYCDSAESLVRHNTGSMPAQFVGPKWLTAIHNLTGCPLMEEAAMFSPLVMRDLLCNGGPALALLMKRSENLPAAANLCASLSEKENFSEIQMLDLASLLTGNRNPFLQCN